jgi:hypothetical protein
MLRVLLVTMLLATLAVGTAEAQSEPTREASSLAGPAAAAAQAPSIIGTWIIESPGPSVRLVQSYNLDGTMLSIHDEHLIRNTQLGVWRQIGEREFLMRNVSYRFDAAGQVVATIENRGIYTVAPDGATMTGRGIRFDLDLAGAPIGTAVDWTTRATRLVPLPLDAPLGS